MAAQLAAVDGLLWSAGIAAWPFGEQGTLSVWSSAAALRSFAHAGQHREVAARTPTERWYVEELFARFALVHADGQLDDRSARELLA